jgi:peptidoglycan/LPS O-acetylase OafA/YrhL
MRLKSLDFLRGIAVVLVMFRHHTISPLLEQAGWIGVDLFFVLSGFLVSGLLFSEFKKYGNLKPFLFLARRGLKIYPLFYIFIVFIILVHLKNDKQMTNYQLIGELFFLQNYLGGLAKHTWTLAIEEHFYIFLPILFGLLIKIDKVNPFRFIPLSFLIIAVSCFSMRIYNNIAYPEFNHQFHQSLSHIRFDSLFFGVLLSYFHHFHQEKLKEFLSPNKVLIFIVCIIFIIPPFVFQIENVFINTIGLSLLYIGFGGILMSFLYFIDVDKSPIYLKPIINFIAFIGFYSYSIYLWHTTAGGYAHKLLSAMFDTQTVFLHFIIYFLLSILSGVFISKLVEQPFLKIRDKYFPSRSKAVAIQVNVPSEMVQ